MCLGHTPHDVAVAALYIAKRVRPALLMQQQQQQRQAGNASTPTALDADTKRMDASMEHGWWEVMGTSTATVNELGAKLATASQLLGTSSLSMASAPSPVPIMGAKDPHKGAQEPQKGAKEPQKGAGAPARALTR